MSVPTSRPTASSFFSSGNPTTEDHPQGTRRERAGENYHRTLVDLGVLWISECAKNGWTPAELRHEFSTEIDPLLFHSLSGVACNAPDDLLDHWFIQTRPGDLHEISISSLEKIIDRLPLLPPLQDWHLLGRKDLEEDEVSSAGLSPAQQKAHDRIRALLKKAESTTFDKEAEALVEKAEALRQQYRIEDLLRSSTTGEGAADKVISHRAHLHAPWVNYQMRLLGTIARANACTTLLLTRSGIATVFGTADDVEHVLDLFTSLNRQREYFMRTAAGARMAQERQETSSYRRSFMVAYADRIGVLLRRAADGVMVDLEDAAPAAPDTVLPVLRKRSRQANQVLNAVFPHTRGVSVSANNLLGFQDGHEAAGRSHFSGDSAGLSQQRQLGKGHAHEPFPT